MTKLTKIEYKGSIVITTEQLAQVYGCDSKLINNNFGRNQVRFSEGVHYFKLEGDTLKDFKGVHQNDESLKFVSIIYLWTRRGASRHCKMIGTEQAWNMFDELEETYFSQKNSFPAIPQTYVEALRLAADQAEQIEQQNLQLLEAKPKVEFFDAVADSKDAIEIASVAKVLGIKGMGRNNLFELLRNKKILMNNNCPYQKYVDGGYFRVLEQKFCKPNGDTCINIKTLVYQKGVDYIRKVAQEES